MSGEECPISPQFISHVGRAVWILICSSIALHFIRSITLTKVINIHKDLTIEVNLVYNRSTGPIKIALFYPYYGHKLSFVIAFLEKKKLNVV